MERLTIALLAGISSIHTTRWANALADRGHDVHLITLHRGGDIISEKVKVHRLPFLGNKGYFLNVPFLRKLLRKFKPDLLHAHYASGYGTLGRLSGFHPYTLSVWGSDVYDFPYQSPLKRRLLQKNLEAADLIASTSDVMAKQIHKICKGSRTHVTPFGVDTELFKPSASPKNKDTVTIGTVKKLAFKYGIDTLIKGFAEARNFLAKNGKHTASKLRLLIVGGGEDRKPLERLVDSLNIVDVTEFTGAVPHALVPEYLNKLDIYIAASRSESFGVAILEASACALPVIVTDVGGLPEVVEAEVTGKIVERDDYIALAKAIEQLVIDKSLRKSMGQAGLQRVMTHYTWRESVSIMENVYRKVISKKAKNGQKNWQKTSQNKP
jgi:glycosyltransferase involved in cell wall biosynthesis